MKTVDVLMAIRWIKKAWDEVQPQTIINCFRKTGSLPQNGETESKEDPFADIEDEDDMSSLNELVRQIDPNTSVGDYIEADDDLSMSFTFEDTVNWQEELRTMVCDQGPSSSTESTGEDSDDSEEENKLETSSITSYDVALRLSNDLLLFFTQNADEELARAMFNVVTQIENIKLAVKVQRSSILQYFNKSQFTYFHMHIIMAVDNVISIITFYHNNSLYSIHNACNLCNVVKCIE